MYVRIVRTQVKFGKKTRMDRNLLDADPIFFEKLLRLTSNSKLHAVNTSPIHIVKG